MKRLGVLLAAAWLLVSCGTVADRVWAIGQKNPDGFTVDIRTMKQPTEGVSVAYAETQNCHSKEDLEKVIGHSLSHDGYVGGWLESSTGLYYFDSVRLFPEDSLSAAIDFGRQNGQEAIYVLSTGEEISLVEEVVDPLAEYSPNVLIIMYDTEIGKEPLAAAVRQYGAEIIYDYSIIPGMAIRIPEGRTLEEAIAFFKKVDGVLTVEKDRIYHLTDPVVPEVEVR